MDAGYGRFGLRNGKLDVVVETLLNFLCEVNFIGQHIFNVSP